MHKRQRDEGMTGMGREGQGSSENVLGVWFLCDEGLD